MGIGVGVRIESRQNAEAASRVKRSLVEKVEDEKSSVRRGIKKSPWWERRKRGKII